ncbi:MAG: 30S ribosomal protein S14 [Myxococcales bacterium]|nr:30S ribosomal protein S14 [Myxococcales bacterium]
MAKTGKINHNEYRKKLAAKYAPKRAELKRIIQDPKMPEAERILARQALEKLPRNSNPNRIRNRCNATGRPRAYYRKFGLCRVALRDLALKGELPGVLKASW